MPKPYTGVANRPRTTPPPRPGAVRTVVKVQPLAASFAAQVQISVLRKRATGLRWIETDLVAVLGGPFATRAGAITAARQQFPKRLYQPL